MTELNRVKPQYGIFRRFPGMRVGALAVSVFLVAAAWAPAASAATATVDLGTSATYSVLGGQAVTNTGPTVLNGDLGLSPNTASSVTGFPPGLVGGQIHAGDAPALQAQSDLTTAYNDAAGRPLTQNVAGDLVGTTEVAGVYKSSGPLALSGTLTLDGQNNPDSVFIFQIASTLTTATASSVKLINGADACHVFWQVGSSATLGSASVFRGTIMALTSISITTGALIQGRALARNGSVTLDSDTFTSAQCGTGSGATATTTTQTLPAGPVTPGSTIPVHVTVSGAGGSTPTGTVTVFDNGVEVGSSPVGSAGEATVTIPAGSNTGTDTITSHYGGDTTHQPSDSTPGTVRVSSTTASPTTSPAAPHPSSSNAAHPVNTTTGAAGTTALASTGAAGTTALASTGAAGTTALASTGVRGLRPLLLLAAGMLTLGICGAWGARRQIHGRHRI